MFKYLAFFQGDEGCDMCELRDTLGTEDFLQSSDVSLYLEQDWNNLETVETLGEGTRDFVEYVNLDGLLYVVNYNNVMGYLGISAVVEGVDL